MLLSLSARRKLIVGALAGVVMFLVYDATVIDSRGVARFAQAGIGATPKPGARMEFLATAYCKGHTTASGVAVRAGIAAADPALLPEGSIVALQGVPERLRGIYTVLDTGPKIQGKRLDLYMWSCFEALDFGARPVTLTILRLGWSPKQTAPGIR
jgi:3D (Asp-Asp-Asp) domain-containing protein